MAKVALITGSAVRLGREIAFHLAYSGWDLALHYRSSSKEIFDFEAELKIRYPDQRFHIFQTDLGVKEQTQNLIKQVIDRFGHLDLLVNSASVFEPSSLKETSTDLMIRHMMVNYVSPFILMRDFANIADNGQIINIADARIKNNKSDYLSYSLSKKSLWELTKMAALELAPHFRVNAIAPGAVLTPAGKDQRYLEKVAVNTPMKISSGVNSVLKSIDFIIDNEDLTGQLIYCDGGAHLL
ncbi:MAG: SDR family NAD(P)-dependent oxidoreductase [Bacteroidia bacterium]|nr:SDR family NAD(P)-dependent oxidoreductase [Bacteroidia bacterium]